MISYDTLMLCIGFANVVFAFIYLMISISKKRRRGLSLYAFFGWSAAFLYQLTLYIK